MDYERNRKYFNFGAQTNSKASFIGAGIFMLIFGFIFMIGLSAMEMGAIGLIMLIPGVIMIIAGANKTNIFDSDIDDDLIRYFKEQKLKEKALDKLGLDESEVMEIAPVYFDGYHFDGATVIVGKDGKARSSMGRAVYFFFTKNEVHCYTHTKSLIDSFCSEDTDTYFYSDIVSVSTVTQSGSSTLAPGKPAKNYQYDCFKLTTTGGTSVQAALRDKAGAERSINGMRNLIKAKKQGN